MPPDRLGALGAFGGGGPARLLAAQVPEALAAVLGVALVVATLAACALDVALVVATLAACALDVALAVVTLAACALDVALAELLGVIVDVGSAAAEAPMSAGVIH